jgi:hypothetical protein
VTGLQTWVLGVLVLPLVLLSPLAKSVPASWRVYHWLHTWSAYQMQKASSSHAVASVRRSNGKVDTLPAEWVEADEEEKNRTGWKIKTLGDKRYDPAVHGRSTTRFGKADLALIDEDGSEQATWAEASIDNAFQLDREKYLFRDANVSIENLVYDVGSAADGARADGGRPESKRKIKDQEVSLTRPGVLEDVLVPINSRDGYAGQVVSHNQYRHLKSEQSDQETIRDAKNQAWAAAKLEDIETADLVKWALILGLWSAALLWHQDIGAFISGLGGGGAAGAAGDAVGGLG